MKYLTAGIEVCQGISSHGPSTVSQATGRELEYVKVSLKLRRWNLSVSSYGDGIGVYQGISSYGYLKVSQATEVEFEYFKVSEARGLELEYFRAGIGVYQGISSHGPGISSYRALI